MKLYQTTNGILLDHSGDLYRIERQWDELINRDELDAYLVSLTKNLKKLSKKEVDEDTILPPIDNQEVWAAGVTWLRSRDARMEESKSSGAASLYDRVYDAERPELFFKANAQRVSGHKQPVYIRKDSDWNVPEPELTLFINSNGLIQAYTIGNDMSSRSIEGENALYLPQAKIYEKCAGLGPCLYVSSAPVSPETVIKMSIRRNGTELFNDSAAISRMKRSFTDLVGYLFRECDFPHGCFLMTGTCVVPGNDFTLNENDVVEISIDGIGTLENTVATNPRNK